MHEFLMLSYRLKLSASDGTTYTKQAAGQQGCKDLIMQAATAAAAYVQTQAMWAMKVAGRMRNIR
jgi:hypothetical protein